MNVRECLCLDVAEDSQEWRGGVTDERMGPDVELVLGHRIPRDRDFDTCVGSGTERADEQWAETRKQSGPAHKTVDGELRIP